MTDDVIGGMGNNMVWGWIFFTMFSMSVAFMAVALVVYIAPSAANSGIAEMIGYLNGINNLYWFGLRTFFVKSVSIVLACVGGLCIGNIGVLAHIGAMIGIGVLHLPIKDL